MRILLTGASGFIGSQLKISLQRSGHIVIRLVRDKRDLVSDAIFWNPASGEARKEDFEDFDAVIHLAGKGIAAGRWTKKKKESLFLSRCRDTWLLSQILCRLYRPPRVVISASAIGFYGDRGAEVLTEESPVGKGFLADLCLQWERGTDAIEHRGARVVHPRFGAVLGMSGGILPKMIKIFRLRLGGRMGTGEQIMSWIAMDDLVGGIHHCLENESLSGPVNFASPHPVAQREFAHLLAKKLRRPAFFHLPALLLKGLLGEMAEELILASQHAIPKKLLESGYVFRTPNLKMALDQLIPSK